MAQIRIHIAYGSESGNAHALADALADTLSDTLQQKLSPLSPTLSMLDELSLLTMSNWTTDDYLLIVTSTTGNGEAPYNASQFYQQLIHKRMQQRMKADTTTIDCRFAVFGLGDVNYDNFCGFSKVVDGLLDKLGAESIAPRVDADVDYDDLFQQWLETLVDYFANVL